MVNVGSHEKWMEWCFVKVATPVWWMMNSCPFGRFMTASFSWFYRDSTKIFLTSKFTYLLFCNPSHRTETGTAKRSEVLIANHLEQSLWLANKKQGAAIRSYLLHSSLGGAQLCCALYRPHQMIKYMQENNHSPKPKEYLHVDFSSSNFNVQGRIPSTGGDALSAIYYLVITTLTPS
jgi:hypothetical protein